MKYTFLYVTIPVLLTVSGCSLLNQQKTIEVTQEEQKNIPQETVQQASAEQSEVKVPTIPTLSEGMKNATTGEKQAITMSSKSEFQDLLEAEKSGNIENCKSLNIDFRKICEDSYSN